jgi:FtsZ-interacting cell division protein ZipA
VEINEQRYNGEIPSDTKAKNFYILLPINITSSQFSQRPAMCSKLRKLGYFGHNNIYHRKINNGSHGHC